MKETPFSFVYSIAHQRKCMCTPQKGELALHLIHQQVNCDLAANKH